MSAPETHAAAALIGRFFAGELPSEQWEQLLRHVDICEACRARFETTRLAFRALGGRPLEEAPPGLDRADAELIGRLVLAPQSPRRPRAGTWLGLLATAALAGLAFVAVGRGSVDRRDMVERGEAAGPHPGFDVLCLPADDAGKARSSRESGGRCPRDSYLKAMVTAPARGRDGELRHATVVAVDRAWRLRLVTRIIVDGEVSQVLPGHDRLTGGDRVFFLAVFSKQAIDDEAVRQAVDRARANGAPPGARLELPGVSTAHEIEAE